MIKELIFEAASVEEALAKAAEELNCDVEELNYEVIRQAEKKLFAKDVEAQIMVFAESSAVAKATADAEVTSAEVCAEAEVENTDVDDTTDELICEDEEQPFGHSHRELSEEELDTVADTAIAILRDILKYFGAEDANIDEYEGDEGELLLDVVGADLAVLIGRHGKTLDSLQLLVSSAVNKKLGFRYPVVIDVEGYKFRQKQKIENIARSAAARAVRMHQSVKLRPMTPYERRLVHIALRDDKRVSTVSEGVDPNRQVVIKPL